MPSAGDADTARTGDTTASQFRAGFWPDGGTRALAQGFSSAGSVARSPMTGSGPWSGRDRQCFPLAFPPGQAQTVAYGIPTGGYVNNGPAEVSVNGVTVAMINQGHRSHSALQHLCNACSGSKSFPPGDYVVTIRPGGSGGQLLRSLVEQAFGSPNPSRTAKPHLQ